MRVLVIEDEETELKLVTHVLLAAGEIADGHGSGEAALSAIRQNCPDIVLADLSLPGMDGLQLVRLLRADAATKHLIVVAITTFPEAFPESEAISAGFDGYFVKPISIRSLPDDLRHIFVNRNPSS